MGLCSGTVKPKNAVVKLTINAYGFSIGNDDVFDFKRKSVSVPVVETPPEFSESFLLLQEEKYVLVPSARATPEEALGSLMVISKKEDDFFVSKFRSENVEPNMLNTEQTGFWASISGWDELDSGGALIQAGDMFSLGRKVFYVRSLNLSQGDGEDDIYEMLDEDREKPQNESKMTMVALNICRICHAGETSPNRNPLLAPCNCIGSMKYIHLECLRKLAENNKFTCQKSLFTVTYNLKALICEICLAHFPETLEHEDRILSIIDESKINPPYMIFEVSNSARTKLHSIHCIKLNFNSNISIGSGSTNDVRLEDTNVSTHHARFMVRNNGFFISDLDSRYGTFKFLKSFKIHSKFNNVRLSFGKLLLSLGVNYPSLVKVGDLPQKNELKIRFSKLKLNAQVAHEQYESILFIAASSDEEEVEEPDTPISVLKARGVGFLDNNPSDEAEPR